MDGRETLISLGTYLGLIENSETARYLAGRIDEADAGKWLLASAEILKKAAGREGMMAAITIIGSTDYDRLHQLAGPDTECALARHVYDGLSETRARSANLPPFETFYPYFSQFLRRVETTLRGAFYALGVKKEIVDLDNPLAFEAVAELRHLPGRRYGETSQLPSNVRQVTAMVRYVHILIDRYDRKCLGRDLSNRVRQNLDRISAYPWYFAMLEKTRKAEASRPLAQAVEKLRSYPEDGEDKQDLIIALSILLFNIHPSPQLADYLAKLRPGTANRYLQHAYYAVLTLNSLITGRSRLAAQYARKAYEVATDADMKAYDCLLSGCIKIQLRDYEEAIRAFETGISLADLKTRSLIKFYMGVLQYELGDAGGAIDSFREARAGCTDECDAMTVSNNIGTCYIAMRNPVAALKALEEAENSFPYNGRLTARQMRTVTYSLMAIIYLSMREFDLADHYCRKALRTSREAGNTRSVADQLINLGLAASGKKEYARAANYFTSALNYSCNIDYVEGVLYSVERLRQALALDGRHGEVRQIMRNVIKKHPRFSSILMARRW
ncbi:tetratricopeptide repeat protein [Methanocella arvoryzae]|nr:tetratricopeptide repeat protein [Methanocella arvoryzae]